MPRPSVPEATAANGLRRIELSSYAQRDLQYDVSSPQHAQTPQDRHSPLQHAADCLREHLTRLDRVGDRLALVLHAAAAAAEYHRQLICQRINLRRSTVQ